MSDRLSLDGARLLLTGATGGLGHAIARKLRERGATLVLTGRRVDVLEPLAKELDGTAIAADLSDPNAVDRLLEEAGEIDVLVANAALPASGPLDEYTPDEVVRALTVNLQAPILMAKAAARAMQGRSRGHIVFIGSMAGIAASPKASIYNATKFGLRGFSLALREELRATGVGVSLVEPGFVREAGMFVDGGATLPRGVRTVSPDDVAQGVVSAIERNRAEVVVGPIEMRAAARLGSIFPELAAAVQRRVGGSVLDELSEGQRDKR